MIDEKGLKKGFVIASLISTVIGTFNTGIGLYDRLHDHSHQHLTDYSQDRKLDDLERRLDRLDHLDRFDRRAAIGGGGGGGGGGLLSPNGAGDPVHAALSSAPSAIRREYERLLAAIGPRFADGDATTRLQLQAVIIDLQSSVIQQLQDALDRRGHRRSSSSPRNGRTDDRYGFSSDRLAEAATRARNGSIRALQEQYRRMLEDAAPLTPRSRRSSGSGYLKDADIREGNGLFCPYALQLQRDHRAPLDVDLDGDGSAISETAAVYCPSCAGRLEISPECSWKIHKSVANERFHDAGDGLDDDDSSSSRYYHRRGASLHSRAAERGRSPCGDVVEDRVFVLSNRFVVKCHQAAKVVDDRESRYHAGFAMLSPTYACCLCEDLRRQAARGRSAAPSVAVCSSMNRLVDHVCDRHSVRELLADPDIHEVAPRRGNW